MKLSARNILRGKIKSITDGMVNAEVVLELPDGQELVAVVTKKSVESLALVVGAEACAVIKSTNVMLGVE